MNEVIGIFADRPDMATGMAVVCRNLALGLSHYPARIIYFGRFGCEVGFSKQTTVHDDILNFDYVQCEGRVWKPKTVIEAVEHYGVDYIFSEDDFFSAGGLVTASLKTKKPLHLLSPIDSLPIHPRAYDIFKRCKKVYVPNRSYKLIKNGVFLPHGVDINLFHPENHNHNENNTFTFLWVGRDEPRKAMGRAITALEKIYKKVDCKMIIHSDWRADMAKRTARFLRYKRDLPVVMTQMEGGDHAKLRTIYNNADVFICTSKAGGFEMGITEAMACGLPAIVTDWTFMQELIDSICPYMYHSCLIKGCANGLLIPISSTCEDWVDLGDGRRWGIPLGRKWGNISINALADAMRFMVNNREVVDWMGQKALEKAKKYNWNEISGKLYREIIESE